MCPAFVLISKWNLSSQTAIDLHGPRTKRVADVVFECFMQCKAVLGKLQGAVNREGRTIAALFMELPKRIELPDYYKLITKPIDARIIEHRLDHFEYPGVLDFAADVQLMLDNAVRYNRTSEVHHLNGNVLQAQHATPLD